MTMMLAHDFEGGDPHCGGSGELVEYLGRDSFGNWDTREWPCPGCPDCATPAEQERAA